MNNFPKSKERLKKILASEIFFFLDEEKIPWFTETKIRPIRILRAVEKFIDEAQNEINHDLSTDEFIETLKIYEKVIRLMKENPTFVIVESIDFSHGMETMITIEDTKTEGFGIAPLGSTDLEYLLRKDIFIAACDQYTSKDETLTVRKYKLRE